MHLHIFIPQQSLAQITSWGRDTALAGLLARAQQQTLNLSMEALICLEAGLEYGSEYADAGALPFAAISYLGEDLPEGSPCADSGCFMFAEPVHLQLGRDSFFLSSPVPLDLSEDESVILLESLNQHFAAEGLRFIRGTSGCWYLHQAHAAKIVTSHPALAVNRDIHAFLPHGAEAAKWNRLINEIQMLLFAHPLSQARESRGLLACNSLWLWGGGKLPERGMGKPILSYASTPLIKGLSRLGKIECREIPAAFPAIGEQAAIWIQPDESNDGWFQAAANSLKCGNIQSLQLNFAVNGKVLKATLHRRDLWKFWRKSSAVQTYFDFEA